MDLGPNAIFIWTAYGATALVLTALVARAIYDERRQKKVLAKLEAQGVRRRSAQPSSDFTRQ
jgi:heme exporter protein D